VDKEKAYDRSLNIRRSNRCPSESGVGDDVAAGDITTQDCCSEKIRWKRRLLSPRLAAFYVATRGHDDFRGGGLEIKAEKREGDFLSKEI